MIDTLHLVTTKHTPETSKIITETRIGLATLHLPAKPTFEMMTQMKTFYQDSWDNLLWVVRSLLAIVGVALPFVIQWYQNKEIDQMTYAKYDNYKPFITIS
jgi:hypothetical protein